MLSLINSRKEVRGAFWHLRGNPMSAGEAPLRLDVGDRATDHHADAVGF